MVQWTCSQYHFQVMGTVKGGRTIPGLVCAAPSVKERPVLVLVTDGLTNDEIGQHLGLSAETVKKHVTHLLRKFDAANRAELTAKAVACGIVRLRVSDGWAGAAPPASDPPGALGPTPALPPAALP